MSKRKTNWKKAAVKSAAKPLIGKFIISRDWVGMEIANKIAEFFLDRTALQSQSLYYCT